MSVQSWMETYLTAPVDGPALSNSTTPTSILPAAAKYSLPAQWFGPGPGRVIRIEAWGRMSNIVTTPGTLTLDVRFGSVVVFNGGAINLNVVAKTNVSWYLEMCLTCRAVGNGTTANLLGMGILQSESIVGSPVNSAGGNGSLMLPVSAPAVGSGFDSTASQLIDLFATFSIANAGNAMTVHQFSVAGIN